MHFYWSKIPFKEEGVDLLTLNRLAVTLWMLKGSVVFCFQKLKDVPAVQAGKNYFLGLYDIQTQILPLTCNTAWVTNDQVRSEKDIITS